MKPGKIRIVGVLVSTMTNFGPGQDFAGRDTFPLTGEELAALKEMARAYLAEKQREENTDQRG